MVGKGKFIALGHVNVVIYPQCAVARAACQQRPPVGITGGDVGLEGDGIAGLGGIDSYTIKCFLGFFLRIFCRPYPYGHLNFVAGPIMDLDVAVSIVDADPTVLIYGIGLFDNFFFLEAKERWG